MGVGMTRSQETWRRASVLAVGGGLAFWLVNFAISLTPLAAEYRAAHSISYLPMLLEALFGGSIMGLFVSYFLLRLSDRSPTKDPILTSVLLSLIALIAVTLLIEVPAKSFAATSDPLRYFLIAALFNAARILVLGVIIGSLYGRLYGRATTATVA